MGLRQRTSVVEESSDDDDGCLEPTKKSSNLQRQASAGRGAVAIAESRLRKVALRSSVGALMVTGFVGIVWLGHLYLSALVVLIQVSCYAVRNILLCFP